MNKTAKKICCVFFTLTMILCAVSGVCADSDSVNIYRLRYFAETNSTPTDDCLQLVSQADADRPELIPCGTPLGLKMFTDGLIVTDFGEVKSEHGSFTPAKNAGVKKGDIITEINGRKMCYSSDVSQALSINPNSSELKINRSGIALTVYADVSQTDNRLGIWVRSSTAGIGTMTFFNPDGNIFAALGHGVCDIDTGVIMPLLRGDIVSVSISDVIKGETGTPGELCGSFTAFTPYGEMCANSEDGIFGSAENAPPDAFFSEPVQMAYKEEITQGAATIICTVDGTQPHEYGIQIEKISINTDNGTKNMVIRVTDSELLRKTGGIVQGMSGSPIMQNGRLVGAVTHVFVNDSTRGYAIFAETMYGYTQKAETVKPVSAFCVSRC